jgi:hypothetical protein
MYSKMLRKYQLKLRVVSLEKRKKAKRKLKNQKNPRKSFPDIF